jgi:hypothetical protein
MLVFIKRVVSKRFEWCWKREKVSCKKVVQKGACLDCGSGGAEGMRLYSYKYQKF